MAISLRCRELRKRYPGQEEFALGDEDAGVSFEVAQGELFALLGPSGCGKTTTLRIVGGFLDATHGEVEIDGTDVSSYPPYERPTNTVFQSYALFPHKDVADNVGFGLKLKRVPRAERSDRIKRALKMVGLAGFGERRISELSGGMAQRVALARAIVNQPSVLLLDEPLGALDLKLRKEMQQELVRLKRETAATFVHVTHDQEEACAIADRIAVMDAGRIVQIDAPLELYRHPCNSYVAEFLDAGTIVHGRTRRDGDVLEVANGSVVIRGPANGAAVDTGPMAAVLPPDRLRVRRGEFERDEQNGSVCGTVERMTFTGSNFDLLVAVTPELRVRVVLSEPDVNELGGLLAHGESVVVSWDERDIVFVDETRST